MKGTSQNSRVKTEKNSIENKKKLLWRIAAIPLVLIFLIVWGLVEPYILDDEEETAIIPNLPPAWEGQKIGQVSDFQVGMWWDNLATIAKSVDKLIEQQPAAVLITGDFMWTIIESILWWLFVVLLLRLITVHCSLIKVKILAIAILWIININ